MPKGGALRKVTGLWEHTKKGSKEIYFSGKMRSGIRVLVFKNRHQRFGRQDPDYYLWVEKEATFPGEKFDRTVKPPPDMKDEAIDELPPDEAPFPTEEDMPPDIEEEDDYGEGEPPF